LENILKYSLKNILRLFVLKEDIEVSSAGHLFLIRNEEEHDTLSTASSSTRAPPTLSPDAPPTPSPRSPGTFLLVYFLCFSWKQALFGGFFRNNKT
jgi:hypothetical protein